jgi:hypothetical protein
MAHTEVQSAAKLLAMQSHIFPSSLGPSLPPQRFSALQVESAALVLVSRIRITRLAVSSQ